MASALSALNKGRTGPHERPFLCGAHCQKRTQLSSQPNAPLANRCRPHLPNHSDLQKNQSRTPDRLVGPYYSADGWQGLMKVRRALIGTVRVSWLERIILTFIIYTYCCCDTCRLCNSSRAVLLWVEVNSATTLEHGISPTHPYTTGIKQWQSWKSVQFKSRQVLFQLYATASALQLIVDERIQRKSCLGRKQSPCSPHCA